MYVITETIHHGNYRNVRTLTLNGAPDAGTLQWWGEQSPYAWRNGADRRARALADLAATGEAAHGWARYTLTESDELDVELVDDDVELAACPACGDPIDYCSGHGAVSDPHGANVLDMHDAGEHIECHPAGCDVADDVRRQAYGPRVSR